MAAYKNVVVAGASGDLGSHVLQKLIASQQFNITVLKRTGSDSSLPQGVKVVEVDYSSLDSLVQALEGQDAVVSTLTTTAAATQETLIDAAVAAGVKHFLPSEFGSNLDIPSVRQLPVFQAKVAIQDKLIELAKDGKLGYTFVYNSVFLDWGLSHNFFLNFETSTADLFDGGAAEFSTTTLDTVGDGVVGVLSHPEETINRVVYIQDVVITQRELLQLAQKINPSKQWTVNNVNLDELTAKSDARISQGIFDWDTLAPYLFRAIFDPKSVPKFPKLDNELFGIKGLDREQVKDLIKPHVG